MAPQYKLTYFELSGLAEAIRLLLHYGKISFEDKRIIREQWPTLKSGFPLGQLPILEINGKTIYQSTAIERYLASVVGLAGKTPMENWEIDAAVDTINDLSAKIVAWYWESNPATKETLKADLEKETVPFLLSKLNSLASSGYLATGKLTWADIHFTGRILYLSSRFDKNMLDNYPNLAKIKENVESIPQLKAYIAKRPADKF